MISPAEYEDTAKAVGLNVERFKYTVVYLRWKNRVCNTCVKKDPEFKYYAELYSCPKCHLVWYCSRECQDADKTNHADWCCDPLSKTADNGPMRLTIGILPQ